MTTTLFIGNVPFSATQEELLALFRPIGHITRCNLVTDRLTGQSRGFAFVEMTSESDVERAIGTLDGQELQGRYLRVSKALPREQRAAPAGGPRRFNEESPEALHARARRA